MSIFLDTHRFVKTKDLKFLFSLKDFIKNLRKKMTVRDTSAT